MLNLRRISPWIVHPGGTTHFRWKPMSPRKTGPLLFFIDMPLNFLFISFWNLWCWYSGWSSTPLLRRISRQNWVLLVEIDLGWKVKENCSGIPPQTWNSSCTKNVQPKHALELSLCCCTTSKCTLLSSFCFTVRASRRQRKRKGSVRKHATKIPHFEAFHRESRPLSLLSLKLSVISYFVKGVPAPRQRHQPLWKDSPGSFRTHHVALFLPTDVAHTLFSYGFANCQSLFYVADSSLVMAAMNTILTTFSNLW